MIIYALEDKDGNQYDLNSDSVTTQLKKTWRQGNDNFDYTSKVADRSFLDGAVLIGDTRLKKRKISMMVNVVSDNDSEFRNIINELFAFVSSTVKIIDVTNDMYLSVVPDGTAIKYDAGNEKRFGEVSLNFTVLNPYWVKNTSTDYTGTIIGDTLTNINIINDGYFQTPTVITLTAAGPVPSLQLFLSDTHEGIQIDDPAFGTPGNEVMIIDNIEGTVTIGPLNRNGFIADGTGFFQIQKGVNILNMLFADNNVDYHISFNGRVFI